MNLKTTAALNWPVCGIRAGAIAMATLLAALVILTGCDSASFVPPRPPELKEPVKPEIAATFDDAGSGPISIDRSRRKRADNGVRVVELILARPPDSDRALLEQLLRIELAKVKTPFRFTQPDSQKGPSPEYLAGAIRAAVDRGVGGLIVEPRDEAVVIDALYDAIDWGVGVVLLDRPVRPRGGKSIPRVVYTDFADVGRQIVKAVLEADRNIKRAEPGRIVFLHHRSDDPYLEPSFESLLGPCKAAGKPMEMLNFDGDAEQGMALVRKALAADPKIDVLLADDAVGVFVGFRIHIDWTESGHRGFLLAGFSPNDYRIVTFLDFIFALGDRSVGSYASKTSQAIRSLMEGKPVSDVVEVPVTFIQSAKIPTPLRKNELPSQPTGKPKR